MIDEVSPASYTEQFYRLPDLVI